LLCESQQGVLAQFAEDKSKSYQKDSQDVVSIESCWLLFSLHLFTYL